MIFLLKKKEEKQKKQKEKKRKALEREKMSQSRTDLLLIPIIFRNPLLQPEESVVARLSRYWLSEVLGTTFDPAPPHPLPLPHLMTCTETSGSTTHSDLFGLCFVPWLFLE
ncbi:hypothetical protein CHARACLAT_011973 [Characodon lateralis]|uniref:Uncharacterized protein n=1 Tax=Characodon lateralis TaxID=208331 RepID=A0ABU7E942_9TELE|nr:hypothetical protein [Characodon lateralis]